MKNKWLFLVLIPILLVFIVGFGYIRTTPQELVENQNEINLKTQQIKNQKSNQEVIESEQLTQLQNTDQPIESTPLIDESVVAVQEDPIETENYSDPVYCPNGYCEPGECPYYESGYCPGNKNQGNCSYYNTETYPGNGSGCGKGYGRGRGCCR